MKKFLLTLLLLVGVGGLVSAYATNVDLSFTTIGDKNSSGSAWASGYSNTVTYSTAEISVKIESFSKQSQTITDCPVVKAGTVTVKALNNATFASFTFNFKQWGSKTQTATMQYSLDGTNFKDFSTAISSSVGTTTAISAPTIMPDGVVAIQVKTTNTSNQIGLASFDYTLNAVDPGDSRENANLSFAEEAKTLNIGETFTNTLTKADGANVEFSSDKPEVASVDADGTVTALAVGTATITATVTNTDAFREESLSYTLTVKDPNAPIEYKIDFTANTNSWMPSGSNASAVNKTAPNGMAVAFSKDSYYNTSKYLMVKSGAYIEIKPDIQVSEIIITHTSNCSATAVLTVSADGIEIKKFNPLKNSDGKVTVDLKYQTATTFKFSASTANAQIESITFIGKEIDKTKVPHHFVVTPAEGDITIKDEISIKVYNNENAELDDATINYIINGGTEQTYTAPFTLPEGNATLTVKCGTLTTTYTYTVADPDKQPEEATVSFTDLNLEKGQTITLAPTEAPENLVFTYTSSNPAVASIEGNVLTAVAAGSATITAKWEGNALYIGNEITFDVSIKEFVNIFTESFDKTLGDFTVEDVTSISGNDIWMASQYGAKGTGYISKSAHDAESWLISPVISLEGYVNATLSFEHAIFFTSTNPAVNENAKAYVREVDGEWQELEIAYPIETSSYTYINSGAMDLSAYNNKSIELGFWYKSTTVSANTWEIKNLIIKGEEDPDFLGAVVTDPAIEDEYITIVKNGTITFTAKNAEGFKYQIEEGDLITIAENPWIFTPEDECIMTVKAFKGDKESAEAYFMVTFVKAPLCEAPTFSLSSGTYFAGTKVSIDYGENAVEKKYTIGDIEFDYTEPITLDFDMDITAWGVNADDIKGAESSASYTTKEALVYKQITNIHQMSPKGKYILVGSAKTGKNTAFMGKLNATSGSYALAVLQDTKNDRTDVYTFNSQADIEQLFIFEIQQVIADGNVRYRIYNPSLNVYFNSGVGSTATKTAATKWDISFSESGEIIIKTGDNQLYYNAGSPRFKTYSNTQSPIYLYRLVEEIEVPEELYIYGTTATGDWNMYQPHSAAETTDKSHTFHKIWIPKSAAGHFLFSTKAPKEAAASVVRRAAESGEGIDWSHINSGTVYAPATHSTQIETVQNGTVETIPLVEYSADATNTERPAYFTVPSGREYNMTVNFDNDFHPVLTLADTGDVQTGVTEISVDNDAEEAEYYNLQGVRIDNPGTGLYIRRQGTRTEKVVIR